MSAEPVRVALVGAGMMANRYHYPSLAEFGDVALVGISDLVESRAQETAARFGIPADRVYVDYLRMLDEVAPDAVYVLMPPQVVYELAHQVLARGLHLFVEKPLALTTVQADMLAYTAGEHDCLTMCGFQRRYTPALTALRAQVEARGPIHTVDVAFLKSTADMTQPAGFYNGAIDPVTSDGVHAVDTLRWLAGGEVEDVQVTLRRIGVPGPVPNALTALIGFSTGAVGTVHYNLVTGRRIFRSEFSAINATAHVDPDRESWIVTDDGEPVVQSSRAFATGVAPTIEDRHWLGFWHEHRHFMDCIKAGVQPSSNFADAAKTMHLVTRLAQATTAVIAN